MKPLTDKQRLLAQEKAKGATDVEACKAAGYKAKSTQAASNQVARMMTNDEFTSFLTSLRRESRSKTVKTAQDVKEDLSSLMDEAKREKDFSGYVGMANRLAKMEGHDEPEKHQLEIEVVIGGNAEN